MGGEWIETTLSDVSCDVSYGYTESAMSEEVGPKFLRITDIKGGVVNWESVPYCPISEENHDKYKLANGDIVVARTGNSTGENYPFRGGADAVFASYLIRFRLDTTRVDPRFIWYNLRTPRWWEFINSSKTGSAQAGANAKVLRRFPLRLPPLHEQQAIACILGSLDDKIEFNRQMNRTLEEMARAIFKSWFIDFDPVRAKAAVRREHPNWTNAQISRAACPNLKPEIAELFPDSFEDSELGEIPKGWEVGTLGDVADHPRRTVQPSQIEPQTPYIALEHMPRRCIALSDWSTGDGLESSKFSFRKGEILFGKLRPYFHKVGVAPVDGVCSTDIVVIAPRTPFYFALVMGIVSSDEFIEYTNAGSTGTKMPRTSWAEMTRYDIALPPKALAQAFTDRVVPEVDRIIAAIHESRTLAALRDALLPKLISGKLRVPDAERIVGRCV